MRNSSTKCSVVMPVLIVLSVMVTCTAGYFTTVFGYQVQIGPISSEHQYGNVLDEKLAQDITAHATKVATAIVLERLGNKTGVNNLLTEEFEEKLTDILTNGIKKAFKAKASQYLFLNAMLWIAVVRVSIMCVCLVVFLRREKKPRGAICEIVCSMVHAIPFYGGRYRTCWIYPLVFNVFRPKHSRYLLYTGCLLGVCSGFMVFSKPS